MKTFSKLSFVFSVSVLLLFCVEFSNANWIKSEKQYFPISKQTNSDENKRESLPPGVTEDWLNTLLDDNGNRIIRENKSGMPGQVPEDPEVDAAPNTIFNGPAAGSYFGHSVSSAGDVNRDGYDDIIVGADWGYNSSVGRAYIYFGGLNMNTVADVILSEVPSLNFGSSVSTAGDVNGDGYSDVIVGAYGSSVFTGRAYIYFGATNMDNGVDVTMSGETVGNFFGESVSTAGDVNGDGYSDVVVGDWSYNSQGRAYIYFGGSAMNNASDVAMTGEAIGDQFGWSVSTAGDVNGDGFSDVVVGARYFSSYTGRAYIYFGGSAVNNAADVIMTGELSSTFGTSVSTAGDVNADGYSDVVVGANNFSSGTGSAYVYFGGAAMDNAADLNMTGEAAGNLFGCSVSSAGDVNDDGYSDVIVGAEGFSSYTGRAYTYFGGAAMDNAADIIMTGEATYDRFGNSVSSAGDVNDDGYSDVIAGAWGSNSNTGRAYLFLGAISPNFILTGERVGDSFGYSVSTAGDVNGDFISDVIVGAPDWGSFWGSGRGSAYIYHGGGDNYPDLVLLGVYISGKFGNSVSSAGDVNGDGFSDVIVGAPNDNLRGAAFIYFGGVDMDNSYDLYLLGQVQGGQHGASVSSAGDVNSDGYSDVIVGNPQENIERAYIYYGGAPMNPFADVVMTNPTGRTYFGYSVSSAGDVNGDGYKDVIVGAPTQSPGLLLHDGSAHIYFGGSPMNNIPDVTTEESVIFSEYGYSVSSAGDVNGDSYSDVIVGQRDRYDGRAYIYFGGQAVNNVPDIFLYSSGGQSYFGNSVSSAGDINYDFFSDVIVGAPGLGGSAYVYLGGENMNNISDVTMPGEAVSFGTSVSSAGRFNNSGYPDVIVGAPGYNSNQGRAYIYNTGISKKSNITVNLKMFIEGFYNPQVSDTVRAYLRRSVSPFVIVDNDVTVLSNATGNAQLKFRDAPSGTYYLVVTHRNSIETWSAAGIAMTLGGSISYDFSTSASQAFGGNMIQVDSPPRFAIYSGDVNQDDFVNLGDIILTFNNSSNFINGYVNTDLNGDNITNLVDISIAYNKSLAFVSKRIP